MQIDANLEFLFDRRLGPEQPASEFCINPTTRYRMLYYLEWLNNHSPIMELVIESDSANILHFFMDCGYDPNAQTRSGRSLIEYAHTLSKYTSIRVLVERGARLSRDGYYQLLAEASGFVNVNNTRYDLVEVLLNIKDRFITNHPDDLIMKYLYTAIYGADEQLKRAYQESFGISDEAIEAIGCGMRSLSISL